jgi:serine/threonine-protein kinase HSL1 (negative regulator of Swe1 kinase)
VRIADLGCLVVSIEPVPWTPGFSGPATASSITSSNYAASTSAASSASTPSPKRSWFNNLFSFKPPTCTVLCHDSIANTREKTKRILDGQGVRVAVVEIDGVRGLKCRLDDVKGRLWTLS